MPAYFLFDNLEVTNPERLEDYKLRAAGVVQSYGGRYAVLGGGTELVEGGWKPTFPVMIEFPSFARAREWYFSQDYSGLKALRQSAGRFNAVLIDGVPKDVTHLSR